MIIVSFFSECQKSLHTIVISANKSFDVLFKKYPYNIPGRQINNSYTRITAAESRTYVKTHIVNISELIKVKRLSFRDDNSRLKYSFNNNFLYLLSLSGLDLRLSLSVHLKPRCVLIPVGIVVHRNWERPSMGSHGNELKISPLREMKYSPGKVCGSRRTTCNSQF